MESLQQDIAAFLARKDAEIAEAGQRVALRLSCGLDLPDFARADRHELTQSLARIRRAIQRERMKAARAHWSYDLNRHIALKQAHDALRQSLGEPADDVSDERSGQSKNGARRRRRKLQTFAAKP